MKFTTFALTFRPRLLDDDHVAKLAKWITQRSVYYHIVTEKKDGARHIHAALVLRKEMARSNLQTLLGRLFVLDPAERRHAWCLKVWYNGDWLQQYLDKNDDTVVVSSCLPESRRLDSYFPPVPSSDKPVDKKTRCSVYYRKLESLWNEYQPPHMEVNTVTVRNFLFKMMYAERVIDIIRDDKGVIQVARHLTRWLKKLDESTIELPPYEKEE